MLCYLDCILCRGSKPRIGAGGRGAWKILSRDWVLIVSVQGEAEVEKKSLGAYTGRVTLVGCVNTHSMDTHCCAFYMRCAKKPVYFEWPATHQRSRMPCFASPIAIQLTDQSHLWAAVRCVSTLGCYLTQHTAVHMLLCVCSNTR